MVEELLKDKTTTKRGQIKQKRKTLRIIYNHIMSKIIYIGVSIVKQVGLTSRSVSGR